LIAGVRVKVSGANIIDEVGKGGAKESADELSQRVEDETLHGYPTQCEVEEGDGGVEVCAGDVKAGKLLLA
jgi:hypothetical protein